MRTTCFLFLCLQGEFSFARTAIQTPVPASLARGLLRSLALRSVGEWWGRSKNARHKAAMRRATARSPHKTATYCTSLGEKAPPPGGAGGGRVALLAVRRRRNNSRPFSFCQAFSFGLHGQKKKRKWECLLFARWFGDSSSTAAAVPLVSLRLGHARALTPPRGVIHSPRAASLPTGEGYQSPCSRQQISKMCHPFMRLRTKLKRRTNQSLLQWEKVAPVG